MANNVQITAGSGTTIETIDEGSGVERQVIALGSIGKAGSETQLTGGQNTSANSIPVVVASDQSALPVSAVAASNATVSAYAASKVIKASAGTLYGLSGYNSKTSTQFIQLHDASSLPADTAVPVVIFAVAPSNNFSIDFGLRGRVFSTGIVICNSATGPTKTIGSADCWFDAQFI